MAHPLTPDDRFSRLQGLLIDVDDVRRILAELAGLATTVADATISCSFTMRYEAGPLTVGSSDDRAELLDETQYQEGAGPCLQAMHDNRTVHVADLRTEQRWPAYVVRARDLGLQASLSLPLGLRGDAFGAMNVYSFDGDVFGDAEGRELELFAAQAAGTLRVAVRQIKDVTLLRQMEDSLRSRTSIDQALGIIMASQRCTASTAFELLRRQSQSAHRRLRDIADELINRTTGQAPEPGRPFDAS